MRHHELDHELELEVELDCGEVELCREIELLHEIDLDMPCQMVDSQSVSMLLQSLQRVDSGYWLLDSGASVTVITREALEAFQHTPVQCLSKPMQTANGSDVMIDGFGQILVELDVQDPKGTMQTGVVPLDVMVGQTAFCILSASLQAWLEMEVGKAVRMNHQFKESSGMKACDVSLWRDTPWLFCKPYSETAVELSGPDTLDFVSKDFRIDSRRDDSSSFERTRTV